VKFFDDPKSTSTAWAGVISFLVVILMVMFLRIVFYRMEATELAAKRGTAGIEAMAELRQVQENRLGSYRWVNKSDGALAMPIEDAMARVVATQDADVN